MPCEFSIYLTIICIVDITKGATLDTITQLGYRVAQVTSITAPVLYRMLGNVERGQIALAIDEANKLEEG